MKQAIKLFAFPEVWKTKSLNDKGLDHPHQLQTTVTLWDIMQKFRTKIAVTELEQLKINKLNICLKVTEK